jgi:hypothetical protein
MTIIQSNQFAETPISDIPSFVKDLREEGSFGVHYWVPERSGDAQVDYQRGRQHFREAVSFSFRPHAQTFLAHVLTSMFGSRGEMESGFIDALLEAALVGTPPPALTDEEIAVLAETPQDIGQLRALESEMSEAIACKGWLPDILWLHLVRCLGGANGELIGGAITMIARMALNGSRN